jgi:hypothetical protein
MAYDTMTKFGANEGEIPAENTEKTNSAESSTEKTNADDTQTHTGDNTHADKKDGENNFANHPRWREREDDWKNRFNQQEERHTSEITKLREEFLGSKAKASETTDVPSWFGGDEQQWKEFQAWNESLVGKAKTEALNEIKTKSEAEQKVIDEATKFFTDSVSEIEADKTINPSGEKVDRNKLLKFVLDNELVDTKGRWNYRAGYQLMKANITATKNQSLDERKKLAGATTTDNRAETKPPAFMTSADFSKPGNRPW